MDAALSISVRELSSVPFGFPPPQLLDVRRSAALTANPVAIPRAQRWGVLGYDALYARCSEATVEARGWNPAPLRTAG